MLERRQLALPHLVDHPLNRVFRSRVGLDRRNTLASADIFEDLLRACLVAYDSNNIVLGVEGADNGGNAHVARGAKHENSFGHDVFDLDASLVKCALVCD